MPRVLAVLLLLASIVPAHADVARGLAALQEGDYATALRHLSPSARNGDPVAQFHLGRMYGDGLGVDRDHTRAAVWYRRAAVQGNASAQFRLALAYALGLGVAIDEAKAVRWYRAAAEQGHEEAQLQLGLLLSSESGDELRDHREAVHWLQAGAERGDARAQWRLGSLYAAGSGIAPDPELALHWFREAAMQGNVEAQYELGMTYQYGRGIRRDSREARKWFAMAAERGVPEAQARMAFDPRLRARHLQRARIHDWSGPGPVRVRDPAEIRRGPEAPVRFSADRDVYCDFFPRDNQGGNPKFRCFLMPGRRARGGGYYDESGNVRSAAEAVLLLETAGGILPVLAGRDDDRALTPLTDREGFRQRFVRPLELKVKYRSPDSPDLVLERDMNSEVAATRLLWALHYPADRMYRVRRVHCHRCPRDPFNDLAPAAEGHYTTFDEAAVELRYEAGRAEKYQSWLRGGWSWGEELHRLRYGTGPDSFNEEQKKHFDGLVLLSSIIQHASKRPDQNRLVCLRGAIQQFGGAFKVCADTVLMVNDIGSVFGKRQQESLDYWRAWRVWKNADTCEAALPRMTRDEYRIRSYVIGQAGQDFILGLLDQLTDEHLRALLEGADFGRFDFTLVPPGSPLSPEREEEIIEAWIAAFREKVEQVRAVDCTGP